MLDITECDTPNYGSQKADLALLSGNDVVGELSPERRLYKASKQPTTEVAIRPRLSEDVYVVFQGMSDNGEAAVISAHMNPLVNWIWVGGAILVFGTFISLIPSKPGAGTAPRQIVKDVPEPRKVNESDEALAETAS